MTLKYRIEVKIDYLHTRINFQMTLKMNCDYSIVFMRINSTGKSILLVYFKFLIYKSFFFKMKAKL